MSDTRVTPQPWLRVPRTKPIRLIEIHATRGNTTPEKQKPAALNWVQSPRNVGNLDGARNIDYANPEWGSSFSYVIGTDGSMGTVLDDNQMPTYSAGYGGAGSTYAIDEYAISYECAQSQAQEPFTDAMYERLEAEVASKCLKYGIPPVMVSIIVQKGDVPTGIVRHDRCENGIKLGKTDPGVQFNEVRFIAGVKANMEDDMAFTAEQKQEIRDIIFKNPFIAKDERGKHVSGEHNLAQWMGIVVEHKDDAGKHSAGEGHAHGIPAGQTEEA